MLPEFLIALRHPIQASVALCDYPTSCSALTTFSLADRWPPNKDASISHRECINPDLGLTIPMRDGLR